MPKVQEGGVIFGIRPCDAKSVQLLKKVFEKDYRDPYFLQREENLLKIGLACMIPGENCFCTSLDLGPFSNEGLDLLFVDIGEKYYVEVKSDKGRQLIANMKELLKPATQKDREKRKEVEEKAVASIVRHMDIEGMVDKLDRIFENTLWRTFAMRCLGCGVCTYLCPTCHCFDLQDESTLMRGARVRIWDSCMYPEYTIHTSGHNPRPTRMNRVRNRVYHKFKYYHDNFDVHLCVGCGRCVDRCPVNIDIIDIVSKVVEGAK